MKNLRKGLLMGALISLAGFAAAQPPMPTGRGPMTFSALDQNGDGIISQLEFSSIHAQRQQAPNTQGYPGRALNNPPQFTDFDLNGDGGLSPDEFEQGQYNRMQQRRQQMWGSAQPSGSVGSQGMGPGMGPGSQRGMGYGMGPGAGRNMPAFSDFDLDGNGVLQPQEFEEARAQRIRQRAEQGYLMRNLQNAPPFSSIDGNGDGLVSPQEFTASQALHRQR